MKRKKQEPKNLPEMDALLGVDSRPIGNMLGSPDDVALLGADLPDLHNIDERMEEISQHDSDRIYSQLEDEKFRRRELKRQADAQFQVTDAQLVGCFPKLVERTREEQEKELAQEYREIKNFQPEGSSVSDEKDSSFEALDQNKLSYSRLKDGKPHKQRRRGSSKLSVQSNHEKKAPPQIEIIKCEDQQFSEQAESVGSISVESRMSQASAARNKAKRKQSRMINTQVKKNTTIELPTFKNKLGLPDKPTAASKLSRAHSLDSDSRELKSSSSETNEFWDNDPQLIARCMLSAGRNIYDQPEKTEGKSQAKKIDGAADDQEEQAEPKDYEVFLDIKKSYENSLAKMDTLVKKLQAENRVEKTKRLKYQKIAEEIQEREAKIVRSLQMKYSDQLVKQVAEEKQKIREEYIYQLEGYRQQVKGQMERVHGQNQIIRKLTASIIDSEKTMMNMRFTFYKTCARDPFGQLLLPPRGSGFELLNKNLIHESVDSYGNNLIKQAKRVNVNLSDQLERAGEIIKENYFKLVDELAGLPQDAPLVEQFQVERVAYNRQLKTMTDTMNETIETTALVLKGTNKVEDENLRMKIELRKTKEGYETQIKELKALEKTRVDALKQQIMAENEHAQGFKTAAQKEIKVKDTLIAKLRERNITLEILMKKAVKIMQNPSVMKDAFRKFNFDRYTYTLDAKNNIENFQCTNLPSPAPMLNSLSATNDSLQQLLHTTDLSAVAASEGGAINFDKASKDLILIEAFPQDDGGSTSLLNSKMRKQFELGSGMQFTLDHDGQIELSSQQTLEPQRRTKTADASKRHSVRDRIGKMRQGQRYKNANSSFQQSHSPPNQNRRNLVPKGPMDKVGYVELLENLADVSDVAMDQAFKSAQGMARYVAQEVRNPNDLFNTVKSSPKNKKLVEVKPMQNTDNLENNNVNSARLSSGAFSSHRSSNRRSITLAQGPQQYQQQPIMPEGLPKKTSMVKSKVTSAGPSGLHSGGHQSPNKDLNVLKLTPVDNHKNNRRNTGARTGKDSPKMPQTSKSRAGVVALSLKHLQSEENSNQSPGGDRAGVSESQLSPMADSKSPMMAARFSAAHHDNRASRQDLVYRTADVSRHEGQNVSIQIDEEELVDSNDIEDQDTPETNVLPGSTQRLYHHHQQHQNDQMSNFEENVVIGSSIESAAIKKKRIASGVIPNRVKFTIQPYHQRVSSNHDLGGENGIKISKPEPPILLGKSLTTKHKQQPQVNSMSLGKGKLNTVASSTIDASGHLAASHRRSGIRRPKSTYMNNSSAAVSQAFKANSKASGFMRFNQQSQNLLASSNGQQSATMNQPVQALKTTRQLISERSGPVYDLAQEMDSTTKLHHHRKLQNLERQEIAAQRSQAFNYLFSKYDN